MQNKALALISASLCWLPMATQAQDYRQSAGLSPSPRLRIMAYGEALRDPNTDSSQTTQALLWSQGYYHDPNKGVQSLNRQLTFRPILGWDSNINGGTWNDGFAINGLWFSAAPEAQAKSGLIAGLGAQGLQSYSWASGNHIDFSVQTQWAWSPRHHLSTADMAVAVCSYNDLKNWNFLDLCVINSRSWRDLSDDQAWQSSIRFSHILPTGSMLNDLGIAAEIVHQGDNSQPRVALSWVGLTQDWSSDIKLTLAKKSQDQAQLHQRIDFGFARYIGENTPIDFGLWMQKSDGGRFLGQKRQDKSWGVSYTQKLTPQIQLKLGYSENHSTVAFFDYNQVQLDVQFLGKFW